MLDKKSYAIGLASAGGGSAPVTEEISITANGTYTPPEGVDGYSKVGVNVKPLLKMDYTWRNYGGGNHVTVNAGGGYTGTGYANYDGFGTPFMISIPPERMLQHAPTITENGTYRPEWGKVVYDLRTKNGVLYQIDVLVESREEFDNLPPYQDAILALPCIQQFMAAHGLTAADVSYVGTATIADVKWPLLIDGWMPQIVVDVPTSGELPPEAYELPDVCTQMFAEDKWGWYLDNYYSRAHYKNNAVRDANFMFANCRTRESIPNTAAPVTLNTNCQCLFSYCEELKNLPTNMHLGNITQCGESIFAGCYNLRYVPDSFFADWQMDAGQYTSFSQIFVNCFSMRAVPNGFFEGWKKMPWEDEERDYTYGSPYYQCFASCYCLDELRDIPVIGTYTENALTNFIPSFGRIKSITFKPNQTAQWVNQTLETYWCGHVQESYQATAYNSGITADKQVVDDESYQRLKNDPDWFSTDGAYNRYNHDSAVETINSLPDCSAFCAAQGGTNTIVFYGAQGSATDGGAVNTLTPDEIAVAAVKGWSVVYS